MPEALRRHYRACGGPIVPVDSSGISGQLQARAILSLISDTPESMKFASLSLPSASMALIKTLPLSGRARMKFSGFGANAARPSIDGRHASLIGSSELMRKRTVTGLSPRLVNLVEKSCFRILFSAPQDQRCIPHERPYQGRAQVVSRDEVPFRRLAPCPHQHAYNHDLSAP